MPTRRGWLALAAGLGLWIAARLVGSSDLHMLAAGIAVLPALATLFVRWSRVRLEVHRHLPVVRAYPGTRVNVTLSVENAGRSAVPYLLIEDSLPPSLGRPARLVVTGVPPRNAQRASYTILCRRRGRFSIGPASVFVGDPFGLARTRILTTPESELIVYPEVEDLEGGRLSSQGAGAGESAVRHLYRSAAEFYTMRQYVQGDDLRRIHWPSVARTGELMIRQDESTRRSAAVLFLDNRAVVLGSNGGPGFERAVSAAATLGRTLIRAGFDLRFGTADSKPRAVSEDLLLETLAGIGTAREKGGGETLTSLRELAVGETTLALVMAPPAAAEVRALTRLGTGFGRKIAVLVYPVAPSTLAARAAAQIEGRAAHARSTLQRAGWQAYVLSPDGRLADAWTTRTTKKLQALVSSS